MSRRYVPAINVDTISAAARMAVAPATVQKVPETSARLTCYSPLRPNGVSASMVRGEGKGGITLPAGTVPHPDAPAGTAVELVGVGAPLH